MADQGLLEAEDGAWGGEGLIAKGQQERIRGDAGAFLYLSVLVVP